ncbi:MAG: hypothetical protein JW927_13895 [Deltaproteobacteria bacterium]|nr:hypothetical protein [Deltaproteobacteria bacterium]
MLLISLLINKIKTQSGGIAVSFTLFLTIIVGILTFVLNLGYLYAQKNKYQNAVEAAAMAGALSLCEGDRNYVERIARKIAAENGLAGEEGNLSIVFGFYDEMDNYDDFSTYKDFVPEDNMPDDEYINAVYVSYKKEDAVLIKMEKETSSGAAAVVYLKRIDIASFEPDGEIQIGHNSAWDDVVFFSNGDIKYPQGISAGGKYYNNPEFNDCLFSAAGKTLSCAVDLVSSGLLSKKSVLIRWDSGSQESGANILSGIDPLKVYRKVNDEYLDEWRSKADVIYTPAQAGSDKVFYKSQGNKYYIDPAGVNGVIFFDAEGSGQAKVFIGREQDHAPNGEAIKNLTFVANCPVQLINSLGTSYSMPDSLLYVGGEKDDQATFISTGDIEIYPSAGQMIRFDGAVFRTAGDFILMDGGGFLNHKIRAIADGSVIGKSGLHTSSYSMSGNNIGLFGINCNSRFGPPCPPNIPRLGTLDRTSLE